MLTQKPWFPWVIAAAFVAAMISLPSAPHFSPQRQSIYGTNDAVQQIVLTETPDERLADYTEVLAFFTAMLAIVSIFQGYFLYRTDKAAAKALSLSSDTAIHQLRAQVFLTKASYSSNDSLKIQLTLKNFGATPAYKVVTSGSVGNSVDKNLRDFPAPQQREIETTVPPGHERMTELVFEQWPRDVWQEFDQGKRFMYLWGAIRS